MKKLIALVLALAMVATLGLAFADTGTYPSVTNDHTITIDNTDQNVAHSYTAYQVFKGNLNAAEGKLADIDWGSGVNVANLFTAIASSTHTGLAALRTAAGAIDSADRAKPESARKIAEELGKLSSTSGENEQSGAIDAFAQILGTDGVLATAAGTSTADSSGKKYTIPVSGDGYYFIKDTTTGNMSVTEDGVTKSDTKSKYLLSVIRDTTIKAKDTGLTSDKEIVKDTQASGTDNTINADDNNVAIGDTVTYKITLDPIPNTAKYNVFKLVMRDNLDAGLTFTGITGIAAYDGSNKVADFAFNTDYKFTVKDNDGTTTYDDTNTYTAPAAPVDANAPKGGQEIVVTFKNFKAKAENDSNNLIGKKLVITYTAVLNKNATYGETNPNKNTEKFIFSNDPNYDYSGDDITNTDPKGETPSSTTRTYSTTLKILKKADSETGANLAGAVFKLTGTDILNYTLTTGIVYKRTDAISLNENFADDVVYYKLKDGSWTNIAPGSTVDGRTVNNTQYEDVTATYRKVKYSDVVTTPAADYTQTVTSGNDGIINFKGLRAGTYTIQEIHAPDGYNLDDTIYTLKIKWTKEGGYVVDTGSSTDFTVTDDGAEFVITIVNKSGTVLPSTGGIGTTIFYIVGGLLVIGAAVILVARRKAHE